MRQDKEVKGKWRLRWDEDDGDDESNAKKKCDAEETLKCGCDPWK